MVVCAQRPLGDFWGAGIGPKRAVLAVREAGSHAAALVLSRAGAVGVACRAVLPTTATVQRRELSLQGPG